MWEALVFLGWVIFLFFFKKSKRIDIVLIHFAPVLCGLCIFPRNHFSDCHHSHRVLDDVAATHTTFACVYVATRGREEVG